MQKIRDLLVWSILLFTVCQAVIDLDVKKSFRKADIEDDPYVSLTVSNNNQHPQLPREYYVIKAISKQKRRAYIHMKKIYDKTVKILKKYKIIPNSRTMVESRVKPRYLSKKRCWQFSLIFMLIGDQSQLSACEQKLISIGVKKLNTVPSLNFLKEKYVALELFMLAKEKVVKLLKHLPDYFLDQVQDIEIHGRSVQNSDIIEEQLQEQFNDEEEPIEEEDLHQNARFTYDGDITMRVVFKLRQAEQEEQSQSSESNQRRSEDSSSRKSSSESNNDL